jgi:uncharacterized protein (TIGR02147 family)
MKKTLFEYSNYKHFLNDTVESQPNGGRGFKRKIALAAGCQPAYVSHVLSGEYDFSCEQGEAISRFLGHTREETEYFILLVNYARAGTHHLKQFFQKTLNSKAEHYLALKNRVKIAQTLTREDHSQYYSHWHYSAIHMLTTIPNYGTAEKIAAHFSLPISLVREVLEFLKSRRLVENDRGQFKPTETFLHLDSDSPLISRHHTNWRLQAIAHMAAPRENDLHYSSCFSVSAEDARKLRQMMGQFLEEATRVIKPSKEEKLYSLCLDLFEA